MLKRTNEKGHTMLEIILILGFLGAMSVSIASLVTSMYDKYRLSRIGQQVEELKKVINNRYVADGNYKKLSVSSLISERVAPKDMIQGEDALHHVFRGEVRLAGGEETFDIRFMSLPYKACLELAIMTWTVDNTSDLVTLKINDTVYKWPWVATGTKTLPVEMSEAAAACQDSDENQINWEFQ